MADEFKKLHDDILEKEIRHDEDKIDAKREDMNEHEAKMEKSCCGLANDIRKEEIKHDEKVIARKEEDAVRHEEKLKENEQELADRK